MEAKSWTGVVVWVDEDDPFFTRRVTAELRLDDEGGRLLSDVGLFGSEIDVRFGWAEVEKVERLRFWGFLRLGAALRFTLAKNTALADGRGLFAGVFTFGGPLSKRTTEQMVEVVESKGVKLERKRRFAFSYDR